MNLSDKFNQAKYNVKYLSILDKFIEPLYEGTPITIKETLPALMNAIKMIHTVAKYYHSAEAMNTLFRKITFQMIENCKDYIIEGSFPKTKNDRALEDDEPNEGITTFKESKA